ncbi:MAG: RNA polymerase sigma factor [Actinomycetota bacterium]|nr:sigma-70 family RNA polymerase sigma factor [Actinomycetota bacterium]
MRGDDFLEATLGAMDRIYSLARRLTREDRGAAEDLVQETYLHAFDAWTKHRRPDRVEPWLVTICLNIARSDFRAKRRRPDHVLVAEHDVGAHASSDVAGEAMTSLDRESVRRALLSLPEQQRIAITLVDVCGLTAAEAARATGSPRGTILSRVHRGRKTLAELVRREVEHREP